MRIERAGTRQVGMLGKNACVLPFQFTLNIVVRRLRSEPTTYKLYHYNDIGEVRSP